MYFKKGKAKLLLGICRGRKLHDKREKLKKHTVQRDIQRALRRALSSFCSTSSVNSGTR